MALKDNVKHLRDLLVRIQSDLEKADKGNKAASQRVRTGTVKLEKIAKQYRKESVANEKKPKGSKPKAAAKAKPKAKAPAKAAAKAPAKAAAKAKPKAKAHKAKARAFALRRPTAKLPARRFGAR